MKKINSTLPDWFDGEIYDELYEQKKDELIDSGEYEPEED